MQGSDKLKSQKQANRSHVRLRGPGERTIAQLKSWRLLGNLRWSPSKAGHLVKAITVLRTTRPPEEKGSVHSIDHATAPTH